MTSPAGQAALVANVYQQWVVGAPHRSRDAAMLFENENNPGDPRVQRFLSLAGAGSWRQSGGIADSRRGRRRNGGERDPCQNRGSGLSAPPAVVAAGTALVTVDAGGVMTGLAFVPGTAADLTSPTGVPIHLMALEKSPRPAVPGPRRTTRLMRAAIVNVPGTTSDRQDKTPTEMEAIIWRSDSANGVDHGDSARRSPA